VASIPEFNGAQSSVAVLPHIHKNKHYYENYRRKRMEKNE